MIISRCRPPDVYAMMHAEGYATPLRRCHAADADVIVATVTPLI